MARRVDGDFLNVRGLWDNQFADSLDDARQTLNSINFRERQNPNFKGDGGEKIFLVSKIFAAAMFAGIIYLTQAALWQGVLTAIFSTYAVSGIINSLIALMTRDKL